MIFRYFLRITRKSVELGNNDRLQEHRHNENKEKIKKLEEKNGHELAEIKKLQQKIQELETIIKNFQN